eukprot:546091_1
MSQANTKSKSAANSEIVDTTQNQHSSNINELQTKLIELQKELETKHAMLQTAGSIGQQIANENDELQMKLNDTTKLLKEKEDEFESLKKTNEMLTSTATRSGAEADELHTKLIYSQQQIKQLREDYALLKLMNDTSSIPRESSDSFDKNTAHEIISKLKHEKKTLEEFLRIEQNKCSKFFQNAEINARNLSHKENKNQDLKVQIAQLQNENNEITQNTENDISKYVQTIQQLQFQNESLTQQLNDLQQIANSQKIENIITTFPMHRINSNDDLHTDLEALGYFETNSRLLSSEQLENLNEESIDLSPKNPSHHFRKATIDAQEEFFRLTVIAAKIKFNDVPIDTATLWDKVKKADISFHEVADWLNDYLTSERKKQKQADEEAKRARITSITDKQCHTSPNSPSKHFFRKIKDLADSVTNFSSTLRLEVRFGRRVFEVKMKKHDKLETLLQTLPRIIGEDADSMEIYKGKYKLNQLKSLTELGLNNNDILRMIHRKKVDSYLRRYEHNISDDISGIEMNSESLKSRT